MDASTYMHACTDGRTRDLPEQIGIEARGEGLEEIDRLDLHHPAIFLSFPSLLSLRDGGGEGAEDGLFGFGLDVVCSVCPPPQPPPPRLSTHA